MNLEIAISIVLIAMIAYTLYTAARDAEGFMSPGTLDQLASTSTEYPLYSYPYFYADPFFSYPYPAYRYRFRGYGGGGHPVPYVIIQQPVLMG